MKTEPKLIEEYREQIRQCAQNLAVARTDVVTPYLPNAEQAQFVDVYADGNLEKRVDKLTDQFEFMAEEFDELGEWIGEYTRTIPLAAYDTGSTDSVIFLDWVEQRQSLTPEQTDLVTCHRSRIEVEEIARDNRMGHIRFQEMLSATEDLSAELDSNEDLWVHLNPIRVWARFETTVLLEDEDDLPATVVFYPVGSDVRTAVLDPFGQIVIDKLESLRSAKTADLFAAFPYDNREAVIDICRDLAEMGLISFG
jgi:hypothetical protein